MQILVILRRRPEDLILSERNNIRFEMWNRTFQGDILTAEGHHHEAPEHNMSLTYYYKDPKRVGEHRPVVDVSAPFNVMDETHRMRKLGVAKTAWTMSSLNALIGAQEQVPYTDSFHSFELGAIGVAGAVALWVNQFVAKSTIGNSVLQHPKLVHASNIVFAVGMTRTIVAASIGSFGYWYLFEFLYTHVPGFKIRDPSPNGYHKPWEEGQNTMAARVVAATMPTIGYILYAGRLKRAMSVMVCASFFGVQYDYARAYVLSGMRNFYNFQASKQLTREAQWGSLTGNLNHRNDPDTYRTSTLSQFRYIRLTSGMLQDTVWENATHETLPLHNMSRMIANPYYNWQKAPQTYNPEPIVFKNSLWKLPSVLDARMRSGVLDSR